MQDKRATILSAFSPPVPGARGTPPPKPSVTPGLGARMRAETGHALEQALTQGSQDALSRFGLKAATAVSAPLPGGGSFLRPVGKALGIGALGAAGALALNMHHQNAHDQAQRQLVYAPLGGYT